MATPKAAEPESREQAAESGAALVQVPHGVARLQRPPVVNTIDEKTLALIASQIAPGCSRGEIGHFLELCAHYDLDPFAREAWCAKGRGDNARLLIMVGRDGLRKIAKRQGLEIDGDVVRERDTFKVTRNADRSRSIEHAYAETHADDDATAGATPVASHRGAIVGAWAEVFDRATGSQAGYFYAPLTEYRPKDQRKLQYSPWGSQESVMILAAAERQALRQATPLGGLLAEGEDARIADADVVEEPEAEQELTEQEVADLVEAIEGAGWSEENARMRLVAAGAGDVTDLATGVRSLRRAQALEIIAQLTGADGPPLGGDLDAVPRPDASDGD